MGLSRKIHGRRSIEKANLEAWKTYMAPFRATLAFGFLALCTADDSEATLEIGGAHITGTSSGQLKLPDILCIGDSALIQKSMGTCHGNSGDLILNQHARLRRAVGVV